MWWSEVSFTIFGILLGGFIGHRLAIGRDKRKERNEARYRIWRALRDYDRRSGIPDSPANTGIEAVALYKSKVSKSEWMRYAYHAREVERIRHLEIREAVLDPVSGSYPVVRELTQAEKQLLDSHFSKMIHITRQS